MGDGKYSHYAVRVGKVKGVYTSWEECAPQVLGVSGEQFKGFKSLEEALEYMQRGETGKGKMTIVTPTGAEKTSPLKAKLAESPAQRAPTQPSSSVYSGGSQFGTDTGGGFAIVEDMEMYLWRACRKLAVGPPVFDRKVAYDVNGNLMFGFSAELRSVEKGIEVGAEGCFHPDELMAREDAAFKLLDSLLRKTGQEMCDFNFRRNFLLKAEGRADVEN
ncbi:hypothetical protein PIB30_009984 [Stylosanthes scabra]|uniref:Ribonuclease H1 N-terminal domain-containing protein n=1 Tax=Stylosanthes scabra TaxID=79078 RepID=A0ABU6U5J7_9FABA|nr:hypothetical protein [Stylosanthes scabra]